MDPQVGRNEPGGWLVGANLTPATTIINLAVLLTGVTVAVSAHARGRPEEVAGGVAIAVLATVLSVWSLRSRSGTLPFLAAIGSAVQIAAMLWYYFSGFSADANAYHRAALVIVDPDQELTGRFSFQGTTWANFVTARATAAIYQVTVPSQLLAFTLFSSVGLATKVLFARTLLRLRPQLGGITAVVALGVVLYPSLALWLSPISKEAFSLLGISVVIAGIARPSDEQPSFVLIATGILLAAATRPHVAMLLAISAMMYAAVLVASRSGSRPRSAIVLVGAAGVASAAIIASANVFDIDASLAGFGEVRENLASLESQGGSAIEAREVSGVSDIPMATVNVLLRPHLFEARSLPMLLQALETTLLVLVVAWLLLQGRRRRANRLVGAARQHIRTLRVFAVTYLAAFVFAFSGMYNLGLMSRQRIQVTPIILLLIAMSLVTTRLAPRTITSPLQQSSQGSDLATARAVGRGPLLLAEAPSASSGQPLPASQSPEPSAEPVRPSSGPSA